MAGDGAAIGGALAAEASGALAALGAAHQLGRLTDDDFATRARPLHRSLARHLAIRPFLDELYRPPTWIVQPADATIVCRCEEVKAGQIKKYVEVGCLGPNQTKAFGRCGMGPCQGRFCAPTTAALIAEVRGLPPEDVAPLRPRAPYKPITVGALAETAASVQQGVA